MPFFADFHLESQSADLSYMLCDKSDNTFKFMQAFFFFGSRSERHSFAPDKNFHFTDTMKKN